MHVDFETRSADFLRDPYPHYQRLREFDPIHYAEMNGVPLWDLTRYQDVVRVLRDARFSAAKFGLEEFEGAPIESLPPMLALFTNVMLVKDPPDHRRLRALVSKAFTPRHVERLRPRVRALADSLLDEACERGSLELIEDFAAPLPLLVIAELLGVPVEDRVQLKRWSNDLVPLIDGSLRDEALPRIAQAAEEIYAYLTAIVEERRRQPREDLLSGMLSAQVECDVLTDHEVIATAGLLLIAGHETTTNWIGNGVHALLEHPEALAELRDRRDRIPTAAEELLRYDPPVQVTSRIPKQDFEIHGHCIPAGQEVDVWIGAANRDPAIFPNPDQLNFRRGEERHLSFGHGIHFCLGAPLARVEMQVALERLLERIPRWERESEALRWRPAVVMRGLEALRLKL